MQTSNSISKPAKMKNFSRSEFLPAAVAGELRNLIVAGIWTPGMQMPGELELTKQLGVSRGTLRTAIEELVAQGYIVRRHGVGTFIHRQPLITNNLSINSSVSEMLISLGMKPGCAEIEINVEPASKDVLADLGIQKGEEIVVVKRVRTADGRPVIYSVDNMSPSLLSRGKNSLSLQQLKDLLCQDKGSFYNVLNTKLGIKVDHALAKITPIKANDLIADKLNIPIDSVLLCIHQIDYTKQGLPIMISTEYHVADISTHFVYRKATS
jgi:GntR family transcriptional regulator